METNLVKRSFIDFLFNNENISGKFFLRKYEIEPYSSAFDEEYNDFYTFYIVEYLYEFTIIIKDGEIKELSMDKEKIQIGAKEFNSEKEAQEEIDRLIKSKQYFNLSDWLSQNNEQRGMRNEN